MKITISKVVGNKKYMFEVEKPDFNEAYKEAAMVDMLPTKCDACGSDDLFITFKKPQGFNYPGIHCRKCTAESQIQGKKDGSAHFMKRMEPYQKPDGQQAPQGNAPQQGSDFDVGAFTN